MKLIYAIMAIISYTSQANDRPDFPAVIFPDQDFVITSEQFSGESYEWIVKVNGCEEFQVSTAAACEANASGLPAPYLCQVHGGYSISRLGDSCLSLKQLTRLTELTPKDPSIKLDFYYPDLDTTNDEPEFDFPIESCENLAAGYIFDVIYADSMESRATLFTELNDFLSDFYEADGLRGVLKASIDSDHEYQYCQYFSRGWFGLFRGEILGASIENLNTTEMVFVTFESVTN